MIIATYILAATVYCIVMHFTAGVVYGAMSNDGSPFKPSWMACYFYGVLWPAAWIIIIGYYLLIRGIRVCMYASKKITQAGIYLSKDW